MTRGSKYPCHRPPCVLLKKIICQCIQNNLYIKYNMQNNSKKTEQLFFNVLDQLFNTSTHIQQIHGFKLIKQTNKKKERKEKSAAPSESEA